MFDPDCLLSYHAHPLLFSGGIPSTHDTVMTAYLARVFDSFRLYEDWYSECQNFSHACGEQFSSHILMVAKMAVVKR